MTDNDFLMLAGGLLLWQAWERWMASSPAAALQRGGANVYELLHPSERGHAHNLPGHQLTKAAVEQIAAAAGFPDPHLAMAVAMAESGGVPNALGDGGVSVGLWQINTRAHPQYSREAMAYPQANAAAALAISKRGTNWQPWSAFRSGAFRRYL